jgi:hypothetical protein
MRKSHVETWPKAPFANQEQSLQQELNEPEASTNVRKEIFTFKNT